MAHLHQLRIIKTQDDCSEFIQWLSENAEVKNVQGWYIVRDEDGRCFQFAPTPTGYTDCFFWATVDKVWGMRRTFNDWIRTYKSKFFDWSVYGQFATEMRDMVK
jgi:hypothetical protein